MTRDDRVGRAGAGEHDRHGGDTGRDPPSPHTRRGRGDCAPRPLARRALAEPDLVERVARGGTDRVVARDAVAGRHGPVVDVALPSVMGIVSGVVVIPAKG